MIAWPQFFYTRERTAELLERLTTGNLRHPIAVSGGRDRADTAASGKSFFVSDRPQVVDVPGRSLRVALTLRTQNPAVAYEGLRRGDTWVGFGWWTVYPEPPQVPRWVQLWIEGAWNYTTDRQRPAAAAPTPRAGR